jgi:type IV protein arginine methyltransferase
LHQFFRYLPNLLADGDSKFSFFNGLGATSQSPIFFILERIRLKQLTDPFFHDVYTNLSELHLREVGMKVAWSDVDVDGSDDTWNQTRKYFSLPVYRLPVVTMQRP